MSKKELQVAAIENGTVIDHIPADKTYQVVKLLRLEEITNMPRVSPASATTAAAKWWTRWNNSPSTA